MAMVLIKDIAFAKPIGTGPLIHLLLLNWRSSYCDMTTIVHLRPVHQIKTSANVINTKGKIACHFLYKD